MSVRGLCGGMVDDERWDMVCCCCGNFEEGELRAKKFVKGYPSPLFQMTIFSTILLIDLRCKLMS